MNNSQIKELSDQYVLPTYGRIPIALVKGKGATVWDADGKKYLDFFSGLAVDNLGHAPASIRKVLAEQSKKIWHTSNVFYIPGQAKLAEALVKASGLDKAFFCNSGTEAVEACIKLARYASLKSGNPERYEIIVANKSFHGRTLGSLSATMQPKYQSGFGPLLPGFKGVEYNNLEAVRAAVTDQTCAVLIEPIQGEGGVNVPDAGYLAALRKLCDERNLFLILDEVQVGLGRTGHLFAHQAEKIRPDLMALSKALGSGFPVGACLAAKSVAQFAEPGIHAATFGGNPLACSVALETVKIISKPAFLKRVSQNGEYFIKRLNALKKEGAPIESVRGRGLMIGCVLQQETGSAVVQACLEKGLLINAIQNRILRFVPPLIVTKAEIDRAVKILSGVLASQQQKAA